MYLCSTEDDDLVNHLHYLVPAQQSDAKSSFQAFHSIKADFTKLKSRRLQISKSIIHRIRLTVTMYASPCTAPSSLDIWNMRSPFKSTIRGISAWKSLERWMHENQSRYCLSDPGFFCCPALDLPSYLLTLPHRWIWIDAIYTFYPIRPWNYLPSRRFLLRVLPSRWIKPP